MKNVLSFLLTRVQMFLFLTWIAFCLLVVIQQTKQILFKPFKRQPRTMVNHTQTIRQLFTDELFECLTIFGVGA